ncbi:MAG: MBL fold metallo-hydrolase [Limnochordia bacterium]|jgi:L-ascorbate metabolism protein UlaG (beta-lactamase superfamily)|nr:MBL fold metallo-hydrolase [Limnochordia bacterium]MDD4517978.1 MBL fold metallo-hydrolase [Limnochordia bacterium]
MEPTITLIKHAGVQIVWDERTIYIDPWELPDTVVKQADVVFVTHPHYDHFSNEDIEKIRGTDTVIVVPHEIAGDIPGSIGVAPGDELEVKGIGVEVVPAYNKNKSYHPQDKRWVGYILQLQNTRVYHAGDTDFIPEMSDLQVDIALLPVGGTYTMDFEQAAEAAEAIDPEKAIPIHYGDLVGNEDDAQQFAARFARVKILPKAISQEPF